MTSRNAQAADLYAWGYGLKEVSTMLGMNHMRVKDAAIEHGVEIRPHGGAKPGQRPVHEQVAPEARRLYRIYRSKAKVAEQLHVSPTTVQRALAVAQVDMEPPGQPAGNRTIPIGEIRQVGKLRDEGKTYAEIMEATGFSETQVRNRIKWHNFDNHTVDHEYVVR